MLTPLFIATITLACTIQSYAQESDSKSFKMSFELPIPWVDYYKKEPHSISNQGDEKREKKITTKKWPHKSSSNSGHWQGFYFHYSNLANSSRSINAFDDIELNPSKSYGWSLNLFECTSPITRNLTLVTGAGYDWNKYRFQNGVTIQNIAGQTEIVQPGSSTILTSIIKTQYITFPLLIDWQIGAHRGGKAFVSFGVQGNLNTRSLSRFHYVNELDHVVKADLNDLNFRFLRADILAQVGIGHLRFTATYSPQSMFKNNKGPDMRPVSIGICIVH